jgi:OOP family OmpA-OmpF porin
VTQTLQAAANGVSLSQNLTLLDDGSPAVWVVEYAVTSGGDVTGKLPKNLSTEVIADAMGLVDLGGDPFVSLIGDDAPDDTLTALSIASEYLPETETLSFATSQDGATLDIVLSPGVNADLVVADLAERLPADVQFSAATVNDLPDLGAIRINRATMQRERFQFGNWLPILTFAPIDTICRERAEAVLQGTGVNFLTGSAQLDAKSIRAINALSSIAQRCINEGNLRLEVGGHTDNVGTEQGNEALSASRAEQVRIAMLERGVDPAFIIAVGYGQSRPIESNDTEDGRAANRRTEFTWSQ